MHAHKHGLADIHARAHTDTCTNTHIRTRQCTYICTHSLTHTHTHAHIRTQSCTHQHTNACTRMHIHTQRSLQAMGVYREREFAGEGLRLLSSPPRRAANAHGSLQGMGASRRYTCTHTHRSAHSCTHKHTHAYTHTRTHRHGSLQPMGVCRGRESAGEGLRI